MKHNLESLTKSIKPLQEKLINHEVYTKIQSPKDLATFMGHHVFAVWDFMSLAKALQRGLTSVELPWQPKGTPVIRHFVNEIVTAEESDVDENGNYYSHYEMYLNAMELANANTREMATLLANINSGVDLFDAINEIKQESVKAFLRFTFNVIARNKMHEIAAAFTFGREDVIPDMFIEILKSADENNIKYNKLKYYLERHIELDGDEHGPLALQMIAELCGEDQEKWEDVRKVAQEALEKRIDLWNAIDDILEKAT